MEKKVKKAKVRVFTPEQIKARKARRLARKQKATKGKTKKSK